MNQEAINKAFQVRFYQSLPHKPYCMQEIPGYSLIRPKDVAIGMPYIQYNPPCLVASLVFDVDRKDAYFSWSDANLPQPNWISRNPENYHAHVGYMLQTPVCITEHARQKIIRYLAKIQAAYTKALGADRGFSGLITKNPLSTEWENHIFHVQPYELGYLADFVELAEIKKSDLEVSGLGRNCIMFDLVRFWAYEAIRDLSEGGYDSWYTEVLKVAINTNSGFTVPLPYSEVKATATSIARWVWRNHGEAVATFLQRQVDKGRKGGLKSDSSHGGKARSAMYSDLRQEAFKLHVNGVSNSKIAEQLKVSRRTVIRWLQGVTVQA
jgi:hypothetical protein